MPFVQGRAIEKARKGSMESKATAIRGCVLSHTPDVGIVATFEDHVLAFKGDDLLRFSIGVQDGVYSVSSVKPSRSIPVIEDRQVAAHVSKQLESFASKIAKGQDIDSEEMAGLASLVSADEAYWVSEVGALISESEDAGWFEMYEANLESIKTTLKGRIRELASAIPKTRYAKIPESKLLEFKKEIKDSVSMVRDVLAGLGSDDKELVFSEEKVFLGEVRKSLKTEAQAVESLLGKAVELMGDSNISQVANIHDRTANRARAMSLVNAYIAGKASPKQGVSNER